MRMSKDNRQFIAFAKAEKTFQIRLKHFYRNPVHFDLEQLMTQTLATILKSHKGAD